MALKFLREGQKTPVLGLGPPAKRHHLRENVDKDGKPDGTYRCVTCIKEDKGY